MLNGGAVVSCAASHQEGCVLEHFLCGVLMFECFLPLSRTAQITWYLLGSCLVQSPPSSGPVHVGYYFLFFFKQGIFKLYSNYTMRIKKPLHDFNVPLP